MLHMLFGMKYATKLFAAFLLWGGVFRLLHAVYCIHM